MHTEEIKEIESRKSFRRLFLRGKFLKIDKYLTY